MCYCVWSPRHRSDSSKHTPACIGRSADIMLGAKEATFQVLYMVGAQECHTNRVRHLPLSPAAAAGLG